MASFKEKVKTVLKSGKEVVKDTSKIMVKGKALKKPKAKIKSISAERIIARTGYTPLVKPGEEGYFRSEYNREAKWLS